MSEEQLAKIAELQKRREDSETEQLNWWQVRLFADSESTCCVGCIEACAI